MYTDDVSVSNHNVAPFSYHNNFTCASTSNTLWSLTAFAWCKYVCLKDHNNSKVFLPLKKHTETNVTCCVPWYLCCCQLSYGCCASIPMTQSTNCSTSTIQHNSHRGHITAYNGHNSLLLPKCSRNVPRYIR